MDILTFLRDPIWQAIGAALTLLGVIVALLLSEQFRKWCSGPLDRLSEWLRQMPNRIRIGLTWLIRRWRFILLITISAASSVIAFRVYNDWMVVAFLFANLAIGFLCYRLLVNPPLPLEWKKMIESESKFLPIALLPGIGNSYLKSRYIDPPSGDAILGRAQFLLKPDSLIFDTNEHIRYYLPRDDGGKEIDLQLPEPANKVKAIHFLLNSGNSKTIYAHVNIGEIRLVFKDAPPIVVPLVLGENIREWCPGNPGDWVRETSSPLVVCVWSGMSKSGTNAVIDSLKIPVYDCMRNCFLEKIILVHKSVQRPPETMGVHFSVFAVSIEIEQRT